MAFALLASLTGSASARRIVRVHPEPSAPVSTGSPTTQAPASGVWFGAWVKPATGSTVSDMQAAVTGFEAQVGRTLDIDHHYYGWNAGFPGPREAWDVAGGRTPLIDWAAANSTKIASGAFDSAIKARADAVRAFGSPLFLRYAWEMDGSFNKTTSVSPRDFIAAWRHMHDIFAAEGATNAAWVWCPTAWGFVKGNAQPYYPGNDYVDWVCTDGYNWYPGRTGSQWRSFTDIYRPFYNFGLSTGKPLMVGECGVQEDPNHPGRKAAWISDVETQLQKNFPAIKAYMYFNSDTIYKWWIDSTSGSLTAFRALAQDPYFNP